MIAFFPALPAPRCRPTIVAVLLFTTIVLSASACAKRSLTTVSTTAPESASSRQININTASAKQLEALPGIGEALAERIIEHRQKYGPFRRIEHLMMVRGISDTRFRAVRNLITVDP